MEQAIEKVKCWNCGRELEFEYDGPTTITVLEFCPCLDE